jgi:hypothetical protein
MNWLNRGQSAMHCSPATILNIEEEFSASILAEVDVDRQISATAKLSSSAGLWLANSKTSAARKLFALPEEHLARGSTERLGP